MRITNGKLEITNPSAIDDLLGYYKVNLRGVIKKMQGARYAVCHFGTFERVSPTLIQYSATVWTERDGKVYHYPDSEFDDDLEMFLSESARYFDEYAN